MQDFPLAEGLSKPIGVKLNDDSGTFAFGNNAMDVIVSKCKMPCL